MAILDREGLERVDDLPKRRDRRIVWGTFYKLQFYAAKRKQRTFTKFIKRDNNSYFSLYFYLSLFNQLFSVLIQTVMSSLIFYFHVY